MNAVYPEKQADKQDAAEIKNYTRVPNMLIFGYRNISPQEKWLYTCLKHMCGKKGTHHLSLRYISEQTGISVGALSTSKNAKGVVNQGMIRHLHDAGLIHCEIKKHEGKGNPQYHITITDVWALNQDFFADRPKIGQDKSEEDNLSEILTGSSEIRTENSKTCPNSEQACPNSVTNIRLHSKTTDNNKTTDNSIVAACATTPLSPLADDALSSLSEKAEEEEALPKKEAPFDEEKTKDALTLESEGVTQVVSAPQQEAPHTKPTRSRVKKQEAPASKPKKQPKDPLADASPAARAIITEWTGIFTYSIPVTPTLIKNAETLAVFNPVPGEIAACRLWVYKQDKKGWYKEKGVHLGTLASGEFEKYRSLSSVPESKPTTQQARPSSPVLPIPTPPVDDPDHQAKLEKLRLIKAQLMAQKTGGVVHV